MVAGSAVTPQEIMIMVKLSRRWAPVSRMWLRGYPIEEIALIEGIEEPALLNQRIKLLQQVYPDAFPQRRGRIKLVNIAAPPRRTVSRKKHRPVKK